MQSNTCLKDHGSPVISPLPLSLISQTTGSDIQASTQNTISAPETITTASQSREAKEADQNMTELAKGFQENRGEVDIDDIVASTVRVAVQKPVKRKKGRSRK
jgi:hypothetical protein